jgi:hypothetical protein
MTPGRVLFWPRARYCAQVSYARRETAQLIRGVLHGGIVSGRRFELNHLELAPLS